MVKKISKGTTKENTKESRIILRNTKKSQKISSEKKRFRDGRWTNEEHRRFLKGCLLFQNSWGQV